ncbi:MAG: hypothetical protein RLZZ08_1857 [Pseudomonadota bacterium]|jgi:ElaB/YqjD/DUF883 family membrane-anchored ribosome-binding protein
MAKSPAKSAQVAATAPATGVSTSRKGEAKSRFNAALDEAKAGVAALSAEAKDRAGDYTEQARAKGSDWTAEAKTKATELAYEGKAKASEAISGLSRIVADNAATLDDKLGAKYGDYARTASQSLDEFSTRLEGKSVEELGEDAREMVRKSPAVAVGLAAMAGYLVARLFRSK